MNDIDNAKGGTAQCSENRHGGNGPKDKLEIEILADLRHVVRFADCHCQDGVRNHPCDDHVGAHGAVIVFLLLGFADAIFDDFEAISEVAEGFVVAGIDVELFRGHFEFDGVAFAGDGGAEVDVDYVVTFGAPGNVVGVAEGVDLEGADVGGEEGKVLCRGGEHVPWVEVEE